MKSDLLSSYDLDPAEIVDIVTTDHREAGLTLREAARKITEEFPANSAKQLSAFIEREKGRPPIGPLSLIVEVHRILA
jgi:hypothetical protein